jgi:hypothetical protein
MSQHVCAISDLCGFTLSIACKLAAHARTLTYSFLLLCACVYVNAACRTTMTGCATLASCSAGSVADALCQSAASGFYLATSPGTPTGLCYRFQPVVVRFCFQTKPNCSSSGRECMHGGVCEIFCASQCMHVAAPLCVE